MQQTQVTHTTNPSCMRKPFIRNDVHNDSEIGKYPKGRCGEYAARGFTERDS